MNVGGCGPPGLASSGKDLILVQNPRVLLKYKLTIYVICALQVVVLTAHIILKSQLNALTDSRVFSNREAGIPTELGF